MTQTIKQSNVQRVGKQHRREHLITAESVEQLCQWCDAGHPLAWIDGGEVKGLQRHTDEGFNAYRAIGDNWQHQTIREDTLTHFVKLAPLAYCTGRPLHVGDKVMFAVRRGQHATWLRHDAALADIDWYVNGAPAHQWHFEEDETE